MRKQGFRKEWGDDQVSFGQVEPTKSRHPEGDGARNIGGGNRSQRCAGDP